jgi:hypothetical protein
LSHCVSSNDSAVGVVAGRRNDGSSSASDNWEYKGNLQIDKNVGFHVIHSGPDLFAYGVSFSDSVVGNVTINGTFTILSDVDACGVCFHSNVATGNITINGTFNISSKGFGAYVYGVYFRSSTAPDSNITINGTFNLSGLTDVWGIYFDSTVAGVITLDGTFTIFANNWTVVAVLLAGDITSGSVTVNGTFCVFSNGQASCFECEGIRTGASLIINGTFTVFSDTESPVSVLFYNDVQGTFSMTYAQFFSNKKDEGNIFEWITDWSGSYKWNGRTINKDELPEDSDADSSLTTTAVYNSDEEIDSQFWIQVISNDNREGNSKRVFNTAYKNALNAYVNNNECPTIAKPWLQSIINKIV